MPVLFTLGCFVVFGVLLHLTTYGRNTLAIGEAGAKNAAILAAQIIARKDKALVRRLRALKKKMASDVEKKAAAIKE